MTKAFQSRGQCWMGGVLAALLLLAGAFSGAGKASAGAACGKVIQSKSYADASRAAANRFTSCERRTRHVRPDLTDVMQASCLRRGAAEEAGKKANSPVTQVHLPYVGREALPFPRRGLRISSFARGTTISSNSAFFATLTRELGFSVWAHNADCIVTKEGRKYVLRDQATNANRGTASTLKGIREVAAADGHSIVGYNVFKVPKPGATGKAGATNKPSWVSDTPLVGESGNVFARRVMDGQYGAGNYRTGPATEFNQIRKWADRHFVEPT